MTRKQPRKDFLFIDEAGDPGHEEGCSDVYVSFCLHVSDQTYHDAAEVVMQFRYWRNITKEIKGANYNPEKQAAQRFYRALARLSEQFAVNCTAVFLRKADFTAALSPADSWEGADALWFRNWVMRQLLETHFRFNRAFSNTLEIVFDRYDL